MKIVDRLRNVTRLFLDTAPVVYFVEENARYLPIVENVFLMLDDGQLTAVTSPVTLAECLVVPLRANRSDLAQAFTDLITMGNHTVFVSIDQETAQKAAELRAKYNLTLTDAFQAASALVAGCEAFLTNDATIKRVTELNVIALDEVER